MSNLRGVCLHNDTFAMELWRLRPFASESRGLPRCFSPMNLPEWRHDTAVTQKRPPALAAREDDIPAGIPNSCADSYECACVRAWESFPVCLTGDVITGIGGSCLTNGNSGFRVSQHMWLN